MNTKLLSARLDRLDPKPVSGHQPVTRIERIIIGPDGKPTGEVIVREVGLGVKMEPTGGTRIEG
jgi:hypothetical protein